MFANIDPNKCPFFAPTAGDVSVFRDVGYRIDPREQPRKKPTTTAHAPSSLNSSVPLFYVDGNERLPAQDHPLISQCWRLPDCFARGSFREDGMMRHRVVDFKPNGNLHP